MADIGTAYVRIAPNMTGMQGKIAAGMKGAGSQATKQLGDEITEGGGPLQNALGKLGGVAKVGGLAIAGGIAAGAAGIAALTSKMLLSGAELVQQLGGSEAVCGQYAGSLQNIAKTAYKDMGLSQAEFLQGANKIGSLFQGAGVDVQTSMTMATEYMQRASDVASIMGVDTTAALEAVTGAAKGNYTMMDNLGVAMNDTSLSGAALEKAAGGAWATMSQGEKVMFAQQYFMEKTAKYAGNYAKENDTLAGSINTTKKAFQDFLSGGGDIQGFIDSIINTIQIAVPKIVEILPRIVGGLSALVSQLAPVIAAALPQLIPAIIDAAVGIMNALVQQLPTIIQTLVNALPQFIEGVIQIALGILKALPQIITILTAAIPQIVDSLVTALTAPDSLTAIIMGAIQLLMAILQAIPVIINALVNAVPTIISNIIATLTRPAFLQEFAATGIKFMAGMIAGIISMIGNIIGAAGRIIGSIAGALAPSNLVRIGGDLLRGLWQGISDVSGWVIDKIKGFGASVLNSIKGIFGIKSPSREFASIGKMNMQGLAKGINDNAGLVTKSIDSVAGAALAGMTGVNSALATGFNSNASLSQSIAVGDYETPAKVIINVDANVSEKMDLNQLASDLGYAVAMA